MMDSLRTESINTWFDLGIFIDRFKEIKPVPTTNFKGDYDLFVTLLVNEVEEAQGTESFKIAKKEDKTKYYTIVIIASIISIALIIFLTIVLKKVFKKLKRRVKIRNIVKNKMK